MKVLKITVDLDLQAEMLCRKMIELRERLYGRESLAVVRNIVQLASISSAQNVYEEAEMHVMAALDLATELEGPDSVDSATCYHALGVCW